MITTNTNWDAKNALLAKRPIYAMQLSGVATVYTSADLAALGITGAPTYAALLKVPQGAAQSVDVVNGTSTIGELTCEVIDQAGAVRSLVGSTTIEGETLTLLVGYPGIAWSEFVAIQTYQVYKVLPTDGYTSWQFIARDKQLLTKKTISLHPENGEMLSADNPWYLGGSPIEIFQALVLLGLELPAATIDQAGIAALDSAAEGLYSAGRPFLFAFTEPFGAKQFLEPEIFKAAGLHAVITNTGAISLRSFRAPAGGVTPAFAFTADNLCGLPSIDRLPVINEIIFRLDWDGNDFQEQLYFLEATSLSAFGRGTQWVVESKGLRSELGGQWFAQWVASRMFKRFAGTPAGLRGGAPTAKVAAFLGTAPVWPGDYVTLTHGLMPDLLTGALGVTNRVYEVIDRSPDYANGRMEFTLLDTGLTGLPAGREWGASSARPLTIGTGTWY